MELPNLLNNLRKEPPKPRYLGIEIGLESVRTVVWEIIGSNPAVVQIGSLEQVDTSDPKKLLNAIDVSLAQALAGITPEPNQMILSLPDSWLSQQEIIPEKKQVLRFISQKMELKPIGFVITIEAIIHYLETKRGHPPTAIVLGLNTEDVSVSIVQNGRILATHTVGRSDDIGADVEEGIARFGEIKTLPSNIVIYDGITDLEQLQQDLIEYDWQSRLPFMHIPKIDKLTGDEIVEAVVLTAGTEYIKANQTEVSETDKTSAAEEDVPQTVPSKHEEFGFTVSHPQIQAENEGDEAETSASEETTDLELDEADDNLTPAHISPLTPEEVEAAEDEEDDPLEDILPPKTKFSLGSLFARRNKSSSKVPPLNRSRRLILMVVLLAILIVGGFSAAGAAYWYLPKATITLYVKPQVINQQIEFVIDPTVTQLEAATNTVPGVPVETEITASSQTAATGEKLVGEQAKGKVVLYNRTDSVKTFEAGTRIVGSSGLAYTLDEDVTIASASSKENPDLSITTEPATVETAITAAAIGAEYNVGNDTEFSVANFGKSSFVARAKGEISGGTSRQITAVAQADIQKLKSDVNQEIEEKVLAQVQQSQQGFTGAVILTNEEETSKETYSAKVGEEAESVSLESRLMVKSITYKKSDLASIVQEKIASEIPDNFKLSPEDISIEVQNTDENEDGRVVISAAAQIRVSPNIDVEMITTDVRGKFPAVTEQYFRSQPGFERVEIDINPDLPPSIKTFPRIKENIKVVIELVE